MLCLGSVVVWLKFIVVLVNFPVYTTVSSFQSWVRVVVYVYCWGFLFNYETTVVKSLLKEHVDFLDSSEVPTHKGSQPTTSTASYTTLNASGSDGKEMPLYYIIWDWKSVSVSNNLQSMFVRNYRTPNTFV